MCKYLFTFFIAMFAPVFASDPIYCGLKLPPREAAAPIFPDSRPILDEYIEDLRNSCEEHFKTLADTKDMITLSTMRIYFLPLTSKHSFSMAITSLYDGENFYEGLSSSCMTHNKYGPAEKLWKTMEQEAEEMAKFSRFLHID